MDDVLQIFKRSICPGMPFFESIAKKPPMSIDDLFKRAKKYSMLEDDVRATTQQVLVTNRPIKNNAAANPKAANQQKQLSRGQGRQR